MIVTDDTHDPIFPLWSVMVNSTSIVVSAEMQSNKSILMVRAEMSQASVEPSSKSMGRIEATPAVSSATTISLQTAVGAIVS